MYNSDVILTYRYRVKNLYGELNRQARAVNFVWNYCNDVQKQALKWGKKWPTGFDLCKLTAGSCEALGLTAATINLVCMQYTTSRQQKRRPFLRWRGKYALGWVPVRGRAITYHDGAFRFFGNSYRVALSRKLPENGVIKDATNFSCNASGHWFLNIVVEIPDGDPLPAGSGVGIDLGLTSLAALSSGEIVANPKRLAIIAERLAKAQRARKKRLARNLHTKVGNARRDHLHKLSTRIVREFDYIAVGNVNAAGLARTKLAKSVNDAAWSSFRFMLRYKAIAHGAVYEEVNEKFTSQVCSTCGSLPASRPQGIADIGIRRWTCSDCGTTHDRDVNAARNILARSGHRAPAEGISG